MREKITASTETPAPAPAGKRDRGRAYGFFALSVLTACLSAFPLHAAYRLFWRDVGGTAVFTACAPLLFLLFFLAQGAAAGFLLAFSERARTVAFVVAVIPAYCAACAVSLLFADGPSFISSFMAVTFVVMAALSGTGRDAGRGKTQCIVRAAAGALIFSLLVFFFRAQEGHAGEARNTARFIAAVEERLSVCGRAVGNLIVRLAGGEGSAARMLANEAGLAEAGSVTAYFETRYALLFTGAMKALFGVLTAVINVSAFLTATLADLFASPKRPAEKRELTVSGFASVIFVIATFLSTLFFSVWTSGAFGVSVINLRIVYLPVMIALGVRILWDLRTKARAHPVVTAITVVLTVLQPVMMLSLVGAYGNLSRKMRALKERAEKDGMN